MAMNNDTEVLADVVERVHAAIKASVGGPVVDVERVTSWGHAPECNADGAFTVALPDGSKVLFLAFGLRY